MVGARLAGQRERADRVAEAAWALFRSRGYEATSVRDIATAAGVSVGTVMGAGGKAQLFLSSMSDNAFTVVGGALEALGRRPVTAKRTLTVEITSVFDKALRWIAANQGLTRDYLVAYLRAGPGNRPGTDGIEVIVSRIAGRCVAHSGDAGDLPAAMLAGSTVYGVFISLVFALAGGDVELAAVREGLRLVVAAQVSAFEASGGRAS